ncbi:PAS domain S-box-containing protein/diguanylate cyclase (GGDEF)-like protein [Catellatospora citrea]|nr:PAS domain S-box-containing protein/diguanylate cyclase (GGDEF)-like protein [Catellatospora citrea]
MSSMPPAGSAKEHRSAWTVVLATAVFTAAAALLVGLGPRPRLAMYETLCVLYGLYTVGALREARRGSPKEPRTRSFWRWATVGGVLLVAGSLVQVVAGVGAWPAAASPMMITKTLAVAAFATITWPMLAWPLNVAGRQRLRVLLDAATVVCGVGVFTWVLAHDNGARPVNELDLLLTLLASGVLVATAFAMVRLILSGSAPFSPATAATGTSALLLLAIGIATDGLTGPQPDARLLFTSKLLSGALLAVTPQVERITHKARDAVVPPRRISGTLPYLAVAAAQVLLIVQLGKHGLTVATWGVIVGMALITALVTVRQKVTATDNDRLIDRLDATLATLSAQERRFRSLVQNATDVTLVVDRAGDIVYASPSLGTVLGVSPQDAVGRAACQALPANLPTGARRWAEQLSSHATHRDELHLRQRDGTLKYLELISTNLLDDPAVNGVVINLRDVTEAKDLQRRLRHEATHDALTGLANRALLNEQLSAGRARGDSAVLLLDLDGFKEVNDQFGHHVGDQLLVVVARRLRHMVRPVDMVARLGGDEFVVLLRHESAEAAMVTARRILQRLAGNAYVDGRNLQVQTSIGVAVGTDVEFDTLLRHADEAMYQAKRSGCGVALHSGMNTEPAAA